MVSTIAMQLLHIFSDLVPAWSNDFSQESVQALYCMGADDKTKYATPHVILDENWEKTINPIHEPRENNHSQDPDLVTYPN